MKNEINSEVNNAMRIVYRDNELFQNYIPEMKKYLESIGKKVEIKSFPKETSFEGIFSWFEKNINSLEKEVLLTDKTSYMEDYGIGSEDLGGEIKYTRKNLNQIMEESHLAAFGELAGANGCEFSEKISKIINPDGTERKLHDYALSYEILFKMILESSQKPEKVYIIQNNLADHFYPCEIKEKKKKLLENSPETYSLESGKLVSPLFKEYLMNVGMPEKKIEVLEDLHNLPIEEMDKNNNWVVIDRHNQGITRLHKANILKVPLEHLIEEKVNLYQNDLKENVLKYVKGYLKEI